MKEEKEYTKGISKDFYKVLKENYNKHKETIEGLAKNDSNSEQNK